MRKITAGLFIALDGVVEAPDQWHFPYFNEEMGAAVAATLGAADTVLFGRKTYDSFAGAWPAPERVEEDADIAVARRRSQDRLWRRSSTARRGSRIAALRARRRRASTALKNEPGGNIATDAAGLGSSANCWPSAAFRDGRPPCLSRSDRRSRQLLDRSSETAKTMSRTRDRRFD